jgi:hypothetical protein
MSNRDARVGRVRTSLASVVVAIVVAMAWTSSSTSAASPSATPAPSFAAPVAPAAVIDLPDSSSAIPIVADGEGIWIGVDGAIVHVDGQTNAQTRLTAPDMHSGDGPLALAPDGLWIGSFSRNLIERLDPSSGRVELKASAPEPVRFIVMGDGIWVGSHADRGLYPVDRTAGTLGTKIGQWTEWATGQGTLWTGDAIDSSQDKVTRFDPATGTPLATITVPKGSGCGFLGRSFIGDVWAGCSVSQGEAGPDGATVVAIDPETNRVKNVVTVPAYGSGLVVDDALWFIVPRQQDDGTIASSLVVVDPATAQTTAVRELGPLDADLPVITSTALWIPDEQGHRVLKFDLADLRP